MSMFFTGITGSLGQSFLKHTKGGADITGIARNENNLYSLKQKYPSTNLLAADVRDRERLRRLMLGHEIVIHAAALKRVPECEESPYEAIKTNVLGTKNVIETAIESGVKQVVVVSTDKAVYPVGAYGITKALAEKVTLAASGRIHVSVVRYGNLLASKGSVVPLFKKLVKEGKPLTITNPKMTRFLLQQSQAVSLIFAALGQSEHVAKSGRIYIHKAPACNLDVLAHACWQLFGGKGKPSIKIIGSRPGEKLHECLLTETEGCYSEDLGGIIVVNQDEYQHGRASAYTSSGAAQMDVPQTMALLEEALGDI